MWEYNKLPPRQKLIRSKWVFKVKYNLNGFVTRFNVTLVAQSFSQICEINFLKTFTLKISKELLWTYLVLFLMLNLFIHQVNIIDAYWESLLGDNKLPIFMKLPLEINHLCQIREGLLYKLLKSLYSLK